MRRVRSPASGRLYCAQRKYSLLLLMHGACMWCGSMSFFADVRHLLLPAVVAWQAAAGSCAAAGVTADEQQGAAAGDGGSHDGS